MTLGKLAAVLTVLVSGFWSNHLVLLHGNDWQIYAVVLLAAVGGILMRETL